MNQKQFLSLGLIISFVAGGIAGALVAPLTYQFVPETRQIIRDMVKQETGSGDNSGGTLQQSNFLDEESATISVVERANAAVVSIGIFADAAERPQSVNIPFDNFFEFGFPFDIRVPQPKPEQKPSAAELIQVGGGSGFIIESDGLIVTNRHVVDMNATFKVVLADGREFAATVLAKDPALDVALMKIEASGLPTLHLGDSDQLQLGQTVIAIGNALSEFGNTVTRGVVSGIGRRVEAGNGLGSSEVIEEAIQTDAAINPGNSGGPLLNLAGDVVGMNTAVSREGQLIGFAIPINTLKKTIESVRTNGRIVRPWLGVRYAPITPRLAEANKLPVSYGVLVVRGASENEPAVVPGSPADKAGLVENDIITEVNDKKLEDRGSLAKEIAKHNVGDTLTLKVLHKGKEKMIKVTLEEFANK